MAAAHAPASAALSTSLCTLTTMVTSLLEGKPAELGQLVAVP